MQSRQSLTLSMLLKYAFKRCSSLDRACSKSMASSGEGDRERMEAVSSVVPAGVRLDIVDALEAGLVTGCAERFRFPDDGVLFVVGEGVLGVLGVVEDGSVVGRAGVVAGAPGLALGCGERGTGGPTPGSLRPQTKMKRSQQFLVLLLLNTNTTHPIPSHHIPSHPITSHPIPPCTLR
eukprot:NODE_5000_length_611_cov_26.135231_g4313_i0.p1 GENE.NODE_5000_length_611_cov_26.135231_g4313_i0~~NODE_5000_length_611_cov_26.135231_g4313_i0.p1  ORF type:complete len:178 (-),score=17.77 NODE_5000_length_611_cov_26.135231_g4313_i0:3-536(-)